jgi:ATP/maltotriose-dependent transcriptional regulator MalT
VQRGDVAKARREIEAHADLATADDMTSQVTYSLADAIVLRAEQRPREALTAALHTLVAARKQTTALSAMKDAFVEAIEAALAVDDLDLAEKLLGELEQIPLYEQMPYLQAQQARFLGRLSVLRGEAAHVESALDRAASHFRELSMPFYVAVTLLEHGEWLVAQHRVDEAKPLLEEAHDTFARLGAKPWLKRTERAERIRLSEVRT